MGMYTSLHLAVNLKKDTPEEVVNILKFLVNRDSPPPEALPDHPFFRAERWGMVLSCDSYYFSGTQFGVLEWDEILDAYTLTTLSNMKNYGDEIFLFLDWLHPYLDAFPGDFLGYTQYEECPEPELLFYATGEENGMIYMNQPPKGAMR